MKFLTAQQSQTVSAQAHPMTPGRIPSAFKAQMQSTVTFLACSAALSLGLSSLASIVRAPAAIAADPAHITQLLETGICQGCDLSEADLTGAHLIGVDLREADLTGTNLTHANLEGADLTGAVLVETDLAHAFLTNAVLDDTIIRDTSFADATLYYTSLDGATINQVDLVGADVLHTPISVGGSYDH